MNSCIRRNTVSGLRQVRLNIFSGRKIKRTPSVDRLQQDLRSAFERLRKVGVKINHFVLRLFALRLLKEITNSIHGYSIIN